MQIIRPRPLFLLLIPYAIALATVAATPVDARATEVCPDTVATTGRYRNQSFGFTVTIPPRLNGHWNSAVCSIASGEDICVCMQDHGRDIPLEGGGQITVFASYNTIVENTLPTGVFRDIESFHGRNPDSEFSVTTLGRYRLEGMQAWHYVAWSAPDGKLIVREAVVAQTPSGGTEILIYIEAPEAQYDAYRPAYQALLRSWRLSPLAGSEPLPKTARREKPDNGSAVRHPRE
jgi:hypothetical protein